jgi:hypothetical protein
MNTTRQIISLIDNVLSNFLIEDLSDRNELLQIKNRLVIQQTRRGESSYVENSRNIYNIILDISARC